MRLREIFDPNLAEIGKISAQVYPGGREDLFYDRKEKGFRPLPGGSGLFYRVEGDIRLAPEITVWDPNGEPTDGPPPIQHKDEFPYDFQDRLARWKYHRKRGRPVPKIVGSLRLFAMAPSRSENNFPIKNALQVDSITVDEDYRGQGIAKALYGIALAILKRPLVAGDTQTPSGRRMWVILSQIPGTVVKGYVAIRVGHDIERKIQTIMGRMGAKYMGPARTRTDSGIQENYHYFSFDVRPNRSSQELKAAVKQKMVSVYNEHPTIKTGLYAIWTG